MKKERRKKETHNTSYLIIIASPSFESFFFTIKLQLFIIGITAYLIVFFSLTDILVPLKYSYFQELSVLKLNLSTSIMFLFIIVLCEDACSISAVLVTVQLMCC